MGLEQAGLNRIPQPLHRLYPTFEHEKASITLDSAFTSSEPGEFPGYSTLRCNCLLRLTPKTFGLGALSTLVA